MAARKAARILTVSEASKRDILHYTGVRPEKVVVVHNGLDARFATAPDDEALERVRLRFDLSHPFVLYVGNIKPHKNLERLIEAFALARAGGPDDLRLVMIGDEISKYPGLRQSVHRHRLDKHVRFFGFQPAATLVAFYRLARAFVFPSLYEGFGLPPLEAMANLTPVVTSNLSSMPEVVGDAALLVDPYDSHVDRRRHPPRRHRRGAARRAHRPRPAAGAAFSWREAAARTLEVYRGVAGTRVMRVALVHDWLTGMRGGEKALEQIAALFPGADLFTLVHVPGSVSPAIEAHPIHTAFIQRLPFVARAYRHYLPLFPAAIERLDLRGFDLVVSCSHCVAKSVIVPPGARHLCYCLTPMRYAWDQFDAYFGPQRVGAVASAVLRPVMARLARWDRDTAARPNRYLAISQYVARRIGLYYNRQSAIVYPPVDTEAFTPGDPGPRQRPRRRFGFGALQTPGVGHRRCSRRSACHSTSSATDPNGLTWRRWPPARPACGCWAASTTTPCGPATARPLAVLLPGEEDFGMVPVEAQACGRPVVALGRGGATETVIDGVTGLLVPDDSVTSWAAALRRAASTAWDTARIRGNAERFGEARFRAEFQAAVDEVLDAPAERRW